MDANTILLAARKARAYLRENSRPPITDAAILGVDRMLLELARELQRRDPETALEILEGRDQ